MPASQHGTSWTLGTRQLNSTGGGTTQGDGGDVDIAGLLWELAVMGKGGVFGKRLELPERPGQ